MKSRLSKAGLGILIFLLLIAAGTAVMFPFYNGVKDVLKKNEARFLNEFTKQTDLILTYKTISPSILSRINMDGIEVFDRTSGEKILTIDKASLLYKVRNLLKGDLKNSFSALNLSEIYYEYDNTKENSYTERLEHLFSDSDDSEKKEEELISEDVKNFLFPLPFTVNAKKITFNYKDDFGQIIAEASKLQFKKGGDKDSLFASMNGTITADIDEAGRAGLVYSLEGRIVRELEGSAFTLNVSEKKDEDYTLTKSEYLIRFENNLVVFNSKQNIIPLRLTGSYDFSKESIFVRVNTENLDPFNFIKIKELSEDMKKVKGTKLTSDTNLYYNFDTEQINWSTKGKAFLSTAILSAQEMITFSLNGNNEDITINYLDADGQFADASFEGTFNIPRLEPNGYMHLEKFQLPNKSVVKADLFLEQQEKNYHVFIPELFLGEEKFNALDLTVTPLKDSVDFELIVNDYSHTDYDTPGEIEVSGSWSYENGNFMQASVSVRDMFLDTVARTVKTVTEGEISEALGKVTETLKPYIFTNEIYLSTDFKTFSFNSPYSLIANTKQEKQMLLLSFDGSEENIHVSQFDLLFNNQIAKAEFTADISPDGNEIAFDSDCVINSIPYSFRGTYHNNQYIDVSGDYGLDAYFSLGKEMEGRIELVSLPVAIEDYVISLSSRVDMTYTEKYGLEAEVSRFSIEESSGKISLEPKLEFLAKLNKEGFVLTNISYRDNSSSLDGQGQFLFNINKGIFDSMNAEIALNNPLSEESFALRLSVSNPLGYELEADRIKNDFYFNGEIAMNKIQVSRFVQGQIADDTITAKVSASGTFNNPFMSVNVENFSMEFNGMPLYAEGILFLENRTVTVADSKINWAGAELNDINIVFDIEAFNGQFTSLLEYSVMDKKLEIPLRIDIANLTDENPSLIPDYFTASIEALEIRGDLLKDVQPFSFTLTATPDKYYLNSDDYLGLSSWYTKEGDIYVDVDKSKPLNFHIEGKAQGLNLNLDCSYINANLLQMAYLFNSSSFTLYKGDLTGNISVAGVATDPEIEGTLELKNLEFNMPDFVPEHIYAYGIKIVSDTEKITIPRSNFRMKNTGFTLKAEASLDRWNLTDMEATLVTDNKKGIPIDINIPMFRIKGASGFNIKASLSDNDIELNGDLNLHDTEIQVLTNMNSSEETEDIQSSNWNIKMNMNLMIGQKVQIVLNPVLRGLIDPQTQIALTMDTEEGTWNVKSNIALRGGEVTWLNRNFYIKEGKVDLNETNENFNPHVTLRAEMRERDSNGNNVTISLSAKNQTISEFNPVFSSMPVKSESEIMELLGQIVTGDILNDPNANAGSLLVATGLDYGLQVTFLRNIENTLRDFMNFDIFSIRTPIMQNTTRILQNGNENGLNLGNFLDNSTVYIGKYFGSSLYADAMMRLSYDDSKNPTGTGFSNLQFQPEIGFEVSSPFANIRWSLAPDMMDIMHGGFADPGSWVPAASITLSWKFSF